MTLEGRIGKRDKVGVGDIQHMSSQNMMMLVNGSCIYSPLTSRFPLAKMSQSPMPEGRSR